MTPQPPQAQRRVWIPASNATFETLVRPTPLFAVVQCGPSHVLSRQMARVLVCTCDPDTSLAFPDLGHNAQTSAAPYRMQSRFDALQHLASTFVRVPLPLTNQFVSAHRNVYPQQLSGFCMLLFRAHLTRFNARLHDARGHAATKHNDGTATTARDLRREHSQVYEHLQSLS